MTHKYSIHQLSNPLNPKQFMWFDYVNDKLGGVDFSEYKQIYNGEIDGDDNTIEILETLFKIFNIDYPEDFHGHSLSVSDIVVLDGVKYYCDSFGWKEIK